MTKPIRDIEAELAEEFSLFDEWMDKYQYIIEMGQALPGLPEADKNSDNIVNGCQSQVWLTARKEGDVVSYQADSDAIITKGLIAMLVRVLSGHRPDEIVSADLAFVDQIGIREHLSPTRSNGLNNMIKKMKYYALALSSRKEEQAL
ncbi:MAG: SufE family protein [Bacteroidetes bacterium]|jgi:cysteine desulfuration protein SufE|nr:MAG: SufE family protein [Bacteroidota bacterium]